MKIGIISSVFNYTKTMNNKQISFKNEKDKDKDKEKENASSSFNYSERDIFIRQYKDENGVFDVEYEDGFPDDDNERYKRYLNNTLNRKQGWSSEYSAEKDLPFTKETENRFTRENVYDDDDYLEECDFWDL